MPKTLQVLDPTGHFVQLHLLSIVIVTSDSCFRINNQVGKSESKCKCE